MAYVAPNGKIQLFHGLSLTPDYNHTIWFDTQAHQDDMFSQIVYKEYNNQMYTRVSGNKCRIKDVADSIMDCNYMRFQNTRNNITKWFYAFITDIKYVNENVTELTFQIDVIQSWYFQGQFKTCFIERQHATDDTWGINIEPEPLVPKEYVSCNTLANVSVTKLAYIMIIGTYNFNANSYDTSGTVDGHTNLFEQTRFSGYASTVKILYFADYEEGGQTVTAEYQIIRLFNNANFVEGAFSGLLSAGDMWDVLGLYVVPVDFFKVVPTNISLISTMTGLKLRAIAPDLYDKWITNNGLSDTGYLFPLPTTQGMSGNTYTPKNNKLLTYPYTYLSVESPIAHQDYKYELFPVENNQNSISFRVRSTCNPAPAIVVYPVYYKNETNNYQFCFTISDFPQLPIYSGSIGSSLGRLTGGAIKIGLGALIGGGAGALASATSVPPLEPFIPSELDGNTERPTETRSGALDAISNFGYAAAARVPTITTHAGITGGAGCTDMAPIMAPVGQGDDVTNTFRISIHQYGILGQTARRFDMFLSKYGYAQNTVAVPNVHARQKWTYIKTRDCNFVGYLPSEASRKINQIMNNGITWWDWRTNIGNYGDFTNPVVV